MPERLTIQINDHDNVAVAVHDLPAGTKLEGGLVTRDPIPQAHKIALQDIPAGGEIVRYGVVLGYAKADIPAGSWINEHMLDLPESPALTDMPWGTRIKPAEELPAPTRTTWLGYRNKVGPAGTRNLLGIVTTVQCAAGVLKVAVERIKKELLPKYPHVDGVVAVTHPYGCGVAINAPLAYLPIRAVSNLIRHPNFGGEIMVVGLGCEKLTYDRVLPPEDITPENVLTLQDYAGHDAMMQAILDMADRKLQRLDRRRREELPLSELLIGMQCGGSDAFSGITANPSAGYAADMLVRGGATVLFSEVTEVRDGVHMLAARCVSAEVRDKLATEMKWYDDYLAAGGVDRDANPTPGNKKGGLANIVEKAMGSIAKSGTSPIVEVLSPAEKPAKHGLIFAATPASDIVCGPSQLASGIGLQVFMTGRGTPYGLDVAPRHQGVQPHRDEGTLVRPDRHLGRPAGCLRRQQHLDHRSLVGRCFHRARRRRSVPEHELVGRRVLPRGLPESHRRFYGRARQHHGEPNLFGMDPLGRYHVHQICRRRGGRCLPDQLELDVQIFGSGPGIHRSARIQRLHRLLPVGSERH